MYIYIYLYTYTHAYIYIYTYSKEKTPINVGNYVGHTICSKSSNAGNGQPAG